MQADEIQKSIFIFTPGGSLEASDALLLDMVRLRIRTSGYGVVRFPSAVDLRLIAESNADAGVVLASDATTLTWISVGWALAQPIPLLVVSRTEEVATTALLNPLSQVIYLQERMSKAEWDRLDAHIAEFLANLSPVDKPTLKQDCALPLSRTTNLNSHNPLPVCAPFESQALEIIAGTEKTEGLSLKDLGYLMNRKGRAPVISLTVNGLRRKGLVELTSSPSTKARHHPQEKLLILTAAGEDFVARTKAIQTETQ